MHTGAFMSGMRYQIQRAAATRNGDGDKVAPLSELSVPTSLDFELMTNDWLRLGPSKVVADGSIQKFTAHIKPDPVDGIMCVRRPECGPNAPIHRDTRHRAHIKPGPVDDVAQ